MRLQQFTFRLKTCPSSLSVSHNNKDSPSPQSHLHPVIALL